MLKTGLKSFVYSFSVSLFAIVSVNRAFFYEKKPQPLNLDIRSKSIALYLAETKSYNAPVKKIALNTLSEPQKKVEQTPPQYQPEIIVASSLDNLDIPLEFVESITPSQEIKTEEAVQKKPEIVLADVLYAPSKPLPMPEIKSEPVYQPEESLEIKIASAPVYTPQTKGDIKTPPPFVDDKEVEQPRDNSLLIARSEPIGNIPINRTKNPDTTVEVQLGNTDDLQHIAFANNNIPIQSMSADKKTDSKNKEISSNGEWKQMSDSPWVVAKSSGSKNLFLNKDMAKKTNKEVADLTPSQKGKKGVLVASETPKNLIIPIPEEILNKEDITPQLAYPITSEDKQKEIDINAKIKEAEKKEKKAKEEGKEKAKDVLTPIEEELDLVITEPSQTPVKPNIVLEKENENTTDEVQKEGLMNTLSSIFSKTAKSVSEATDKVLAKASETKNSLTRKKAKNKPVTILPKEIRLSFQPNRAEISGQTLRWIQAFATKAAQTSGATLEVRIDGTSSTKLQQKRLNLLYNILTNKGVDYSMINTVFTSRDPNSFILRTVMPKNNNKQGVNNQKTNRYIQW